MGDRKTYEYYYAKYQLGLSYTENIDYAVKKAVSRNNRGVKMYRKAAQDISTHYPERIADFAAQLDDTDSNTRTACAVCIISLMNAPAILKEKAYSTIRELAENGCPFERCVWGMWLRDHPQNQ